MVNIVNSRKIGEIRPVEERLKECIEKQLLKGVLHAVIASRLDIVHRLEIINDCRYHKDCYSKCFSNSPPKALSSQSAESTSILNDLIMKKYMDIKLHY